MTAKLSITLEDDFGRTTKRVYGMEDQVLLATYLTAITAFGTALEAVTDLGLIKADLLINVIGEDFTVTTGANVDVGATASGWLDTAAPKKASAKIPGIKLALISTDGSMPITGAVATFLAEFETGQDFNLSDGEQIDTWIKGALDK
jgi:hypothetical protein